MGGDLAADKPDLQVAVANRDCVRIVWVIRLALEFEFAADAKTGDDVLAAFERDADQFAVEDRRIADGRIRIAQVAVAGGKDALDERVAFVRGLRGSADMGRRGAVERREGALERGLRRRWGRQSRPVCFTAWFRARALARHRRPPPARVRAA